jgi:hypothetical protein
MKLKISLGATQCIDAAKISALHNRLHDWIELAAHVTQH